jgi:hypothetical protein
MLINKHFWAVVIANQQLATVLKTQHHHLHWGRTQAMALQAGRSAANMLHNKQFAEILPVLAVLLQPYSSRPTSWHRAMPQAVANSVAKGS